MSSSRLDWSKPVRCLGCSRELRKYSDTPDDRPIHSGKGRCYTCYNKIAQLVTEVTDTHQKCVGCCRWIELSQFSNSVRYASGKDSRCKGCKRAKKFGLSLVELELMIESQRGKCFICGRTPSSTLGDYLNIDHCHRSGKIRNLLCNNCNIAIGHFRDNPDIVRSAVAFLYKDHTVFPEHLNKKRRGNGTRKHIHRLYHLRDDGYTYLLDTQGHKCPVCSSDNPTCVDHDHSCCKEPAKSCGKCIRGILCKGCNIGLGHMRDDVSLLLNMINYLEMT